MYTETAFSCLPLDFSCIEAALVLVCLRSAVAQPDQKTTREPSVEGLITEKLSVLEGNSTQVGRAI